MAIFLIANRRWLAIAPSLAAVISCDEQQDHSRLLRQENSDAFAVLEPAGESRYYAQPRVLALEVETHDVDGPPASAGVSSSSTSASPTRRQRKRKSHDFNLQPTALVREAEAVAPTEGPQPPKAEHIRNPRSGSATPVLSSST
eukprot:CAMPEP_0179008566 /NCGR_PEP_ID=MMETSP0795-20121207/15790_1 /TAXON_ID=88552 /ORGANISM="Amoebophrya sp., Strain Ameob2" /LENGTH=143 /DNA_ID=CAMNT_0020703671 /DNA_START=303 /DNA_END=731 /DNA_ORIENTATION=-